MGPGSILLNIAMVTGILTVGLWIANEHFKKRAIWNFGILLQIFTTVLLTSAFLLLSYYFAEPNLEIKYVFEHTKGTYPWDFKLAGIWSGQEGTVLMWGWLVSLFATFQYLFYRRAKKGSRVRSLVLLFTMLMVVGLTAVMLLDDVFEPTDRALLALAPLGRGLNPLLQTPLMLIHPPLEFIAYAMTALPAAGALAYFISEDENWSNVTLVWVRASWLFYSIGLGIGGLWAYYVLSFGGFWAWDPVETANILPWLVLTGMLHLHPSHARSRKFKHILPVVGITPFILTIYATVSTRSGWFVSVHAFADLSKEFNLDPAARLIDILGISTEVAAFLSIAIAVFFGFLSLVAMRTRMVLTRSGRAPAERSFGKLLNVWVIANLFVTMYLLFDLQSALSALFEIGYVLGFGNTGIGFLMFVMILGIPPLAGWLGMVPEGPEGEDEDHEDDDASDDEPEEPVLKLILKENTLIQLGALLLVVSTIVVIFLHLLGVNGSSPTDYEDRAPVFIVPILGGFLVWMASGLFKKDEKHYSLIALVIAPTMIPALLRVDWPLLPATVFSFALIALVFSLLRFMMFGVETVRKKRSMYIKVAGPLLLLAGFFGMLYWGNPPGSSDFLSITAGDNYWVWVGGFIASGLTLTFGLMTARGGGIRTGIPASLLAMVSYGYSISLFLGIATLGILIFGMSQRGWKPKRIRWGALRASVRRGATVLLHVAFALVLVGVSWNIGLVDEVQEMGLNRDGVSELGDYGIRIKDQELKDRTGSGWYRELIVTVEVLKDDEPVGTLDIRLWFSDQKDHYEPEVGVLRLFTDDIYVHPYAIFLDGQGWIYAHGDDTRIWTTDVVAIAVLFKVQPGITFAWGGMWFMMTAMTLIMITDTRKTYLPR